MIRFLSWLCAWCLLTATPQSALAQVVLPLQFEQWRFENHVKDPSWFAADFDDSTWAVGAAPLGFGETDIATTTFAVDGIRRIPVTTCFRSQFSGSGVESSRLRMKFRTDDACVVYLNGQEIYRWNLSPGIVSADTLSSRALSAPDERLFHQFDLPATVKLSDTNVIAVEVHQCDDQSSDLYFDLTLTADRTAFVTNEAALRASLDFNSRHIVNAETRLPDGFRDGGRGMQIDEFGNVVSGREVLVVDRQRDDRLQTHIGYARSPELQRLSATDRATRLARYVDRVMTPEEGRDTCESRSDDLADQFEGQEVLLGDVVDFCGAGVCRHRSLLFKVLADEARLKCTMVRGNLGTAEDCGGHTWNEMLDDNGEKVIIDIMNPQPDFYFPKVGEAALRHYLTIARIPMYVR